MANLDSNSVNDQMSLESSEGEWKKSVNTDNIKAFNTKGFYFAQGGKAKEKENQKSNLSQDEKSQESARSETKLIMTNSLKSKSKPKSNFKYNDKEEGEDRKSIPNKKTSRFQILSPFISKDSFLSPGLSRKKTRNEGLGKQKNSVKSPTMRKPKKKSLACLNLLNSIGKILRVANRAKKNVFYKTFSNLSPQQFSIINDRCHEHIDKKDPKATERIIFKNKYLLNITKAKAKIKRLTSKSLKSISEGVPTLHPNSNFPLIFKFLLCNTILFMSFSISLEIFFDTNWHKEIPFLTENEGFLNIFSVALFVTEIILNFNTGFYFKGQIILDRASIICRYLRSSFFFDVLSILPLIFCQLMGLKFMLFCNDLAFLKLIFFLKLLNLQKIVTNFEETLSLSEKVEGILSFLKLIFKLGFMAHMLACFWNRAAFYDSQQNWLIKAGLENNKWYVRYLFSLYWSVTTIITVGYGDIAPQNLAEVGLSIVAMIVGCGVFGYSINSIGTIFKKFENKKIILRGNLKILNRYMKRKNLNSELQERVRQTLTYIIDQEEEERFSLEQKILEKLPFSLRDEVLLQTNGKILENKLFINYFSEDLFRKVVRVMKRRRYAPEEIIFKEGEVDNNNLYFVVDGVVELFVDAEKEKGKPLVLKQCKVGDTFGEIDFFTGQTPRISARSSNFCSVFYITREDFLLILKDNQTDLETFCLLRDRIMLYGDQALLMVECISCGQKDHEIYKCPFVSLSINKESYILKQLHNQDRKRTPHGRNPLKAKNALKQHKEVIEIAGNLSSNLIESYLRELTHITDAENDVEPDDINFLSQDSFFYSCCPAEEPVQDDDTNSQKSRKTIKHRKNSRKSIKSSDLLAISEEKIEKNGQPVSAGFFSQSGFSIIQKQSPLGNFETKSNVVHYDRSSLNNPFLLEDASIHKNQNKPENTTESISTLKFDSVRNFDIYFPYNNCFTIAKYFNKKVIERGNTKTSRNDCLSFKNKISQKIKSLIEHNQQQKFFVSDLLSKRKKISDLFSPQKSTARSKSKLSLFKTEIKMGSILRRGAVRRTTLNLIKD